MFLKKNNVALAAGCLTSSMLSVASRKHNTQNNESQLTKCFMSFVPCFNCHQVETSNGLLASIDAKPSFFSFSDRHQFADLACAAVILYRYDLNQANELGVADVPSGCLRSESNSTSIV